jgi:hypothetical protein
MKWTAMDVLMSFTDSLSAYEEHVNMRLKALVVIPLQKNQRQINQVGSPTQCQ